MVVCFVVAGYIHPLYLRSFLDTLGSHALHILLSAAHPGHGGVAHFNEQPLSYWIGKLEKSEFDYDDGLTKRLTMNSQWYSENRMFFRKPE